MSENPFEAPKPALDRPVGEPMAYQHDGSGRSYVRQVNVVASLMIAQGVLMLLFALVTVGYAVFFGSMQSWMSAAEQARLERELPAAQRQFLAIIFWCWSVFFRLAVRAVHHGRLSQFGPESPLVRHCYLVDRIRNDAHLLLRTDWHPVVDLRTDHLFPSCRCRSFSHAKRGNAEITSRCDVCAMNLGLDRRVICSFVCFS